MYQVLALDLDGTVLNSQQTIHPDLIQAISDIKQKYHVMIVTGRHHTAAKPYYDLLGLSTPIICCNGAYVYDYARQTVLAENAISKSHSHQFLALAREHNMKIVLYVTNSMLYSLSQPVEYMKAMNLWSATFPEPRRPDIRQISSFEQEIDNAEYVWKFVIEGDPADIQHFAQHPLIREFFSGEKSWSNRVDFAYRGNSKGSRLSEYLTHTGYAPDQVVAVGDNHNDISMIELAGMGVAMQHADDQVKSSANQVCLTDNDGDGLSRLICQHFPV